MSYAFHYRDIDSSLVYANRALEQSAGYPSGRAEALNNIAFVNIAKMNYRDAQKQLDSISESTDNQIELLIADIQNMRLCQRQAHNKEFYDYREHALERMRRIHESKAPLAPHLQKRLIYAESEYSFVSSTYYYYVGLYEQSRKALDAVDKIAVLQGDTAQYLNWLYLYGSGSMIVNNSKDATLQDEYEKLLECYLISKDNGYVYWEANAMQSLSEHLVYKYNLEKLLHDNPISIRYFNPDNMPDSLFAGYLAQKSADMFKNYGDVYQTAGGLRTLAQCFWGIGDNRSALLCLQNALNISEKIKQAPDLIASIHEQLSIVYSAMDDKYDSDINRNIYLDMQERTRQDMALDARAAKLDHTSSVMNIMILTIIVLIVVFLLLFIYLLKNKSNHKTDYSDIIDAFNKWKNHNLLMKNRISDDIEELEEERQIAILDRGKNKRRCVEDCSKISLVDNIMPLIDRMINEVDKLMLRNENSDIRSFRHEYISELSKKIDEYNKVLTSWIQLRQGEVGLHIESFPLDELFRVVSRGKTVFEMQGITLNVEHTDVMVKADKILTLFMINTIADNARKFTPKGGSVYVSALQRDGYVEISVRDTGCGMNEQELGEVFSKKISDGHGFGLLNCRGILNKYRKTSSLFNCCEISAESKKGEGSRFFFRLPCGVSRLVAILVTMAATAFSPGIASAQSHKSSRVHDTMLEKASVYADSAYQSNLNENYEKTLAFGDSAIQRINISFSKRYPHGKQLMQRFSASGHEAAELTWLRKGVYTNYSVILSLRNELAVASLALHRWQEYHYNNDIYTRLFKEVSADKTLGEYCRIMQRSEINKNIAMVLLIILFVAVVIVGYVLYYHRTIRLHAINELRQGIIDNLLNSSPLKAKRHDLLLLADGKIPDEYKAMLDNILDEYQKAIDDTNELNSEKNRLRDDIKRIKYESDRLYVSNNILENCLSTIKHETMYYPARIYQCVSNGTDGSDIEMTSSLTNYYKQLYVMLSEQAHREVDAVRHCVQPVDLSRYVGEKVYTVGDEEMIDYMFEILKKQNLGKRPVFTVEYRSEQYVDIMADMKEVKLSVEERSSLFTPETSHIPYLICRQIVREIGSMSNLCGSGITVVSDDGNTLRLRIVLPKYNVTSNSFQ